MKEKERDTWDEQFRNKLYDFEADTTPEDWAAIAGRLPRGASVPFRRAWRYVAAAAVVSLLVVTGGYYMYDREAVLPLARQAEQEGKALLQEVAPAAPVVALAPAVSSKDRVGQAIAYVPKAAKAALQAVVASPEAVVLVVEETDTLPTEPVAVTKSIASTDDEASASPKAQLRALDTRSLIADAAPVTSKKSETSARKWGVGMGAGGLSAGTDNAVNSYMFRNTQLRDDQLMTMNSAFFNSELPKTDIKHKTPVSFGLSVSRYLNNRFSVQTGLSYTFLSSEWNTNGSNYAETKQKLHYLGIPVSVSYKIAEWNRLQFYAAAGAMAEVNVAGKLQTTVFSEEEELSRQSESLRMKEWMWSVNARVGASYPIIRFVSAFAEVGASYYFDNGSSIETIRSEKPFNVNLQIGLRLGF
ncbi:MAG: porin family protein [Tannerellaceae bacterium]